MSYLPNIVGLIGVALVVAAYFLITTQKLTGDDVRYHLLNLVGAVLIFVSLLFNWNTPSAIIEGIWIAISGWGIWRCWRLAKKR